MAQIIIATGSLFLAGIAIMFYLVGNHGYLMFRPHMAEDWIVWGIMAISTVRAFYYF